MNIPPQYGDRLVQDQHRASLRHKAAKRLKKEERAEAHEKRLRTSYDARPVARAHVQRVKMKRSAVKILFHVVAFNATDDTGCDCTAVSTKITTNLESRGIIFDRKPLDEPVILVSANQEQFIVIR